MKNLFCSPFLAASCLLFFSCFLAVNVHSQSQWNLVFDDHELYPGGTMMEGIQTSDGGFVVVGTESLPMGGTPGFMFKLDPNGSVLWYKVFSALSSLNAVIETSDGGFLMGGYAYSPYPGFYTFVKTDGNGDFQWARKYATGVMDAVETLVETPSGYLFGVNKIGMLSLDGDTMRWQSRILQGNGSANDLAVASDGYLVCGSGQQGLVFGGTDMGVEKVDFQGNVIWNKAIGESDTDIAYSCLASQDGGALIAGWTRSFATGGTILGFLTKLDSAGTLLWTKSYGASSFLYDIHEKPNGNLICTGSTFSDLLLMETDPNGNVLWAKTYGQGFVRSLEPTSDGGYFLAGHGRWWTMKLLKTDSLGNSDCSQSVALSAQNQTFQIADANFATFGPQNTLSESLQATTGTLAGRSCNMPVGIASPAPTSEHLYVYPNPMTQQDRLSVEIELGVAGTVSTILVDATGKTFLEKVSKFPSGKAHFELSLGNLPPGIYFLNVSANGKALHKKIAVVE